MSEEIIEQWEAAAEKYAFEQGKSLYSHVNEEIVCKRFDKVDKKSILDLGCGYGNYTEQFRKKGANVIGCDGSRKFLNIAQQKYPLCKFEEMNIEKLLPYKENQFDIVFCNQVLMDIENLDGLLAEIYRITKKNGIFYMSIVHPAFYGGEWKQDESGFCKAKILDKYLTEYSFDNEFWGTTRHFHRTVSKYINAILRKGFQLVEMLEPETYDGIEKTKEIPLFCFFEFQRPV